MKYCMICKKTATYGLIDEQTPNIVPIVIKIKQMVFMLILNMVIVKKL